MPEFAYQDLFPLGPDATRYRHLTPEYVSTTTFEGQEVLKVAPQALTVLAREALRDVSFLYRAAHLEKVAAILDDPEASANDRGVALTLLKNAVVASGFQLPMCQDTGTATVVAKKGQRVWTGAKDEEWLSRGIYETYQKENLRYSQTVPLTMYDEVNSETNLPAQIDIFAGPGGTYDFLFVAKGGGSANKSVLFQETKALLNPASLEAFLDQKLRSLGTAACPPYHLAIVIGGTSAEATMKTVKLASAGYLDHLPTEGNQLGRAFRDQELEEKVMEMARRSGIGAQFGGKYFALDARVVRLPRHGASCPVGIGVSCSADRNLKARIDRDGLWIEEMERDPARFIPARCRAGLDAKHGVPIDLNRPMQEVLAELTKYPVSTPLSLTGTIIVARDIAHAKIKERLDRGEGMPAYLKQYPVYYAGPAKTPKGLPSGSFGPTTAGRMDSYVDLFQSQGGSMIMIAKGNRSKVVTDACKAHGGFYLGSIGGPAALLAQESIKKVELLEYPELGMEAIYKIEVVDFPAFILVDDKGNDFFMQLPVVA
ncbi:MAG: fumarate hydratase [Planctomycetaceae bacterium]|nr:fumarate hydratase [Planctomycetaceae bacterium]